MIYSDDTNMHKTISRKIHMYILGSVITFPLMKTCSLEMPDKTLLNVTIENLAIQNILLAV
jgi:hypothetical protein